MGLHLWLVGGHTRLIRHGVAAEPTAASAKSSHMTFWDEQTHKEADGLTEDNRKGTESEKLRASSYPPDSARIDEGYYQSWQVAVATNQPLQR